MSLQRDLFEIPAREKFQGALALSAVGDALGWPTEFGWYPREVQKRFGRRYLENYISWPKTVGGRFWGYTDNISEGEYSDDTQLTLAVNRCIDEKGDFDPDKFSYFELPLWLSYERGGGRTVKAAARRVHRTTKEWLYNFYETKNLSYRNAGANGAAMRVLPIALASVKDESRLYRDAFRSSIVTHGHPRAILASVLYASAVSFLLKETRLSRETFYQHLQDAVNTLPASLKDDDCVQKWVREWDRNPLDGMRFREHFRRTQNEATEFLRTAAAGSDLEDKEFYTLTRALSKAYKGSGISTVMVALYLFTKYLGDPQKAILTAVNTLGSDTDTIASFVGGLFGSYYGLSAISSEFVDKLQDKDYILNTASDLHDIVVGTTARKYVSSKGFNRFEAYLRIMAWEVGLHEMFWDALAEGLFITHPALGRGRIETKKVQSLRRRDFVVKLIKVSFDCGQTCVFHHRVSKDGELSESLSRDLKRTLTSLAEK